jgi:hypothetical protein
MLESCVLDANKRKTHTAIVIGASHLGRSFRITPTMASPTESMIGNVIKINGAYMQMNAKTAAIMLKIGPFWGGAGTLVSSVILNSP